MHPAVLQHDALAEQWEAKYRKRSFAGRERLIASSLAEVDLQGKLWLDAGCGTGRFARLLAARGCRVHGVDASTAMLAAARETAHTAGLEDNPIFRHIETIESLPFADGSFDGILCSSVIEYVESPSRCLAEMARTLKPGGLLLLTLPNRFSVVRRILVGAFRITRLSGRPWPHFLEVSKHEYGAKALRKFLEEHGFDVVRTAAFGGPAPLWLQKNRFVGSLLLSISRKKTNSTLNP